MRYTPWGYRPRPHFVSWFLWPRGSKRSKQNLHRLRLSSSTRPSLRASFAGLATQDRRWLYIPRGAMNLPQWGAGVLWSFCSCLCRVLSCLHAPNPLRRCQCFGLGPFNCQFLEVRRQADVTHDAGYAGGVHDRARSSPLGVVVVLVERPGRWLSPGVGGKL